MAVFAQEGGSVTGNPQIDHYLGRASSAGVAPATGRGREQPPSPFDKYRVYFYAPDPTRREIQSLYSPLKGRPRISFGAPLPPKSFRAPGLYGPGLRKPIPESMVREDNRRIRRFHEEATQSRRRDRSRLESLARKAGLIGDDFLPSELDAIWQQAINEAEASTAMGKEVSPWDILQHWSKDPERARKYAEPGASAPDLEDLVPPEKRTVTRTDRNIQLTDPKTAKAVVLAGLRSILGRAPKPHEIRQFRSYLNELERKNPVVTRTTANYEGGDLISSESETSGGAPTPSAAFETFTDEEFSDEAYAYKILGQDDEILRAITGSIV